MENFKQAVETAEIPLELKNLLKDSTQKEATKVLFTLVSNPETFSITYDWLYSMLPQNQFSHETVL